MANIGTNMNLEKKEETQLSCEKCGTVVSAEKAARAILLDGQIHVFCTDCGRNVLIIRDGSLTF
jgi:RNase P subunit RPR2